MLGLAVLVSVATVAGSRLALAGDSARAPGAPATAHGAHPADEVLVHDHAPRHGGVVGMAGTRHVEIVLGGGVLRVYLSDLHRAPLPLDGVAGSVVLRDGATRTTLPLATSGDVLRARVPELAGPTVDARVELTTSSGSLLIDFTLPVTGTPQRGARGPS